MANLKKKYEEIQLTEHTAKRMLYAYTLAHVYEWAHIMKLNKNTKQTLTHTHTHTPPETSVRPFTTSPASAILFILFSESMCWNASVNYSAAASAIWR